MRSVSEAPVNPAKWRGLVARIALALGGAALALGLATIAFQAVPPLQLLHPLTVLAAALIPFGPPTLLASAALFALSGRRWSGPVAIAALAAMVLHPWWTRPLAAAAPPAPGAETVRLLTMNMRCDDTGIGDLAALVGRVEPDVVVVQGLDGKRLDWLGDGELPAFGQSKSP